MMGLRRRVPVVLYAHPFELALGVCFLVLGARALITGSPSDQADGLPSLPLILYRVTTAIGGLGVIIGLTLRRRTFGRVIERAALYVTAAGWAAYTVIALAVENVDDSLAVVALSLAAACLLRARAVAKTERVILRTLADARDNEDAIRAILEGRPSPPPRHRDTAA